MRGFIIPSVGVADKGQGQSVVNLKNQIVKGYELLELLGEGGFGAVYRAYQPLVKREVAIKVILPEFANQPDFVRRFETEAQLVARLEHLHIVPLYDYWRDPSGAFLVMRMLKGGNLETLMVEKGPLSLDETLRLVEQISSALVVAHQSNVIHRDLKPANILLDAEGNAYLSDFGIAKEVGGTGDGDNFMVGTPAFIAPEQIKNQPTSPQTDIYCLGLIVYQALTGRHAFNAPNASGLILQQMTERTPYVREMRDDVSAEVDDVIQVATAKDPEKRFADAMMFARAFKQALQGRQSPSFEAINRAAEGLESLVVVPEGVAPLIITPDMLDLEMTTPELVNPYKGLRAFQEGDSDDFFGREALTERLLERLTEPDQRYRFLAVVGPSGSGKSSVVKAGVIPALRRGRLEGSKNWFIVEMVPSTDAVRELEAALLAVAIYPPDDLGEQLRASDEGLARVVHQILPKDKSELVIFIDQFEEVFTQTFDNAVRIHFMRSILKAVEDPASRLRVIITIRADFYDKPLLYPEFGALVRERTEIVLPLNRAELSRTITGPAERVGVIVEEGLVETIIQEVSEEPGALPLLQYALTENFERRQGRVMTLMAYLESGGVLGSLARRAEELHNEMTPEQQEAVRQLFLRLVTLGEGTEDTRRRILWSELAFTQEQDDPLQTVLDRFGKFRLLTFDNDPQTREPTIEVAHEALIRQWERLRQWLANSREDLRIQRRLSMAVVEYRNAGQDPSFLASGSRLTQFETLITSQDIVLTQEERHYILASIDKRQEAARQEEARRQREARLEKRNRQFLRGLVAVLSVAFIGALILSGFAINQSIIAQNERDRAEREAEETLSLGLAQNAVLTPRDGEAPFLPLSLVMEANRLSNPPADVQRALAEVFWQAGAVRRYEGHAIGANSEADKRVWSVAYRPDGEMIASGAQNAVIILWDAQTGQEIRRLEDGHNPAEGRIYGLAFSPDGQTLISGGSDGDLVLWDVATGDILQTFEGHTAGVWAVAFAPDGQSVFSSSADTNIFRWDVANGTILQRYVGHTDQVISFDISPDGTRLVSGGFDSLVRVWDVESGQELYTLGEGLGRILGISISPTGQQAVSVGLGRQVILWNLETREQIRTFADVPETPRGVDFAPNGQTFALAGFDSTVRWLDINSGATLQNFLGHEAQVPTVAFSPDGNALVSGSYDSYLIRWDLYGRGGEIRRYPAQAQRYTTLALSPSGDYALTGSFAGQLALVDIETGETVRTFGQDLGEVYSAVFNDNRQVYVASQKGGLALWDVNTGEQIRRYDDLTAPVRAVALHPQGTFLAAGGGNIQISPQRPLDNRVYVWSVNGTTQTPRFVLAGHTSPVQALAFSPDGSLLASAGDDQQIILWNMADGTEVRRMTGQHTNGILSLAFSPDGSRLASGGREASIILWDVTSGAFIRRFQGHIAAVRQLAFVFEGEGLLSASGNMPSRTNTLNRDDTIILWDVAIGEELRRFRAHTGPVTGLEILPQQDAFLTVADDGQMILWHLETLEQLIARNYASYDVFCLSDEERAAGRAFPGVDDRCQDPNAGQGDSGTPITIAKPAVPPDLSQVAVEENELCSVDQPPTLAPIPSEAVDTTTFRTTGDRLIGFSTVNLPSQWDELLTAWVQAEARQTEGLELLIADPAPDLATQVASLEALLAEGIDALIVNPSEQGDQSVLASLLREAQVDGVAVILVGNRLENPQSYTTFVGVNDFLVGCVMAQELVAALDGEGNVIRLNGIDPSLSNTYRRAGGQAVFELYTDITFQGEAPTDLDPTQTQNALRGFLNAERVDAVFAYDGTIALAALQTAKAAGRPLRVITGDHLVGLTQAM